MKFKPPFRALFVERLTAVLSGVSVWSGVLMSFENTEAPEALTNCVDRDILTELKKHISENPIVDFVREYVQRRLGRELNMLGGGQAPLSTMTGFSDLAAVASDLVDALEGVPYRYAFLVQLPQSFDEVMPKHGVWNLNADFQIVKGVGIHNTYEVPPIIEGRPAQYNRLLSLQAPQGTHLVIHGSGFVDGSGQSHPYHRAVETVRGFFGICMAFGLLNFNPLYIFKDTDHWMTINREIEGKFGFERATRLGTSTSYIVSRLRFRVPENMTQAQWAAQVGRHLVGLKYVLGNADNSSRMLIAAQWYFDSMTGDNELLQFVQAMVALEKLVGGKNKSDYDNIGIGELLRNRLAYLIGRNIEERDQIMETFNEIYAVRSKIVHSGHNRLTQEQRQYLWTLREYVARVIRAEAGLMMPPEALLESGWMDAIVEPPLPQIPGPAPKWEPSEQAPLPGWGKPTNDDPAKTP